MTTKFTVIDTTKPARPGTTLDTNDGRWVQGCIGEYTYQAKVYACGSRFGIYKRNISKLWICHEATRKEVVNYDRGWDILPEDEHVKEMVDALVEHYHAD